MKMSRSTTLPQRIGHGLFFGLACESLVACGAPAGSAQGSDCANAPPPHAVLMSPVSLTTTGAKVTITSDDISKVAQRIKLAPDVVKRLGVTEGQFEKAELMNLFNKLDPSPEDAIAQLQQTQVSPLIWDGTSELATRFKSTATSDLKTLGDDASLQDLEFFTKLQPGVAAHSNAYIIPRVVQAARQVGSAKRDSRDWLAARLAKARFKDGIAFTVDISSSSKTPLMVAPKGYVSFGDVKDAPVMQVDRRCNDAATGCRLSFAGDWEGRTPIPTQCDSCTWRVSLLVNGLPLTNDLPGKFTEMRPHQADASPSDGSSFEREQP